MTPAHQSAGEGAERSRLGRLRSAQVRRVRAEEGLAHARRWKVGRRPTAYTGPYPIKDAPTCADWG